MAFSDAAIGFYLQMEDEMTPQFPGAVSKYRKFVASMEKLNARLYGSTAGAQSHLGSLMKGLTKLAKVSSLQLDLQLTPKSRKSFTRMIGDAVAEALGGARLRLRAALPSRLSKLFSQDETLRQFYLNMPQPPDMVGGFKVERFAEGGKVPETKGRRGKDSVLGLLTPGEVVIPTKLVKSLEKAFTQVEKRKGVIEAGFGSKEDVAYYSMAIGKIAKAMEALADATKNAGIEAKTRLTPQVVQLRERFAQLTKVEQEASAEADHFLGRVLGPTRFIALQASLRGIQDGFSQLSGGLQQAAGDVGAGEFQSFPDRLREIRQRLGLSAEAAVEFTGAIAENSKTLGTNFFKSLEATDALIGVGIKDRKQLIEQSAILSRANRVTGADFDSLAKSMRLHTNELGGSTAGFEALVLSIDNMTKSSDLAVNTPELMESLTAALNNPILKDKGPAAVQNYANNLLGLRAAAETVWQGESGIEQIFADALSGNVEAMQRVSFLTKGQISNLDELQGALMSKNGVVGAFDLLVSELQGLDQIALQNIGEKFGLDGKFLTRLQDFTDKQRKAGGLAVPLDDASTAGVKLGQSMDKMTSAAERLNNTIANFVGSSGPMQTLVEFLDQVPVIALLAGAHLGGTLLRSVLSLGKGMAGLVGGIFGKMGGGMFGKLLGGAGGAAGALGGAAGGAMTGPAIAASGAKIALVLGAVAGVLLLIGAHADELLPILEATLPGLMKIGKFIAEEVAIGISDTLISLGNIFAPLAPMGPTFEAAGSGMFAAAKMLGSFALVGAELAVLGTAATIADGIGKILDFFGVKSPMVALREQSESVVDTLLALSHDFQRLAPVADRVPKLQVGLEGSAKLMTSLKPLLEQAAVLGDAAGDLGDGWFTSGPLSHLRTQAEPMIDTITELSTWFTRIQANPKALAGVDFAHLFFSKLAVTVAAMQQVGSVDAGSIRAAANALLDVRLSQPTATAAVSKEAIDQIMQVVVQSGEASPLHKDLQETNDLLRQLISAVQSGGQSAAATVPTRVQAPTTRLLDPMIRDLTEMRR